MAVFTDDKYRIKRSKIYEDAMKDLINAQILKTYRDILVLSAAIGYANNRFRPIDKPAADGVLMQFFKSDDKNMMDLLAFIKTKDPTILFTADKYQYFEGYANGGFPIVLKILDFVDMEDYASSVNRKETLISLYAHLITGDYVFDDDDFFE